jgi:hypothetical protein
LFEDYIRHAQQRGVRRRQIETAIGMFLNKFVPGLRKTRSGSEKPARIYQFPPLVECRAAYAQRLRTEPRWNDEEDEDWVPAPDPF